MKIIIQKEVLLQNLNEWTKDKLLALVASNRKTPKLKTLLINETESNNEDAEDTYFTVRIYPTLIVEVNESEMNFFLNVIDNHYCGKMFIDYLGESRFDLIFER